MCPIRHGSYAAPVPLPALMISTAVRSSPGSPLVSEPLHPSRGLLESELLPRQASRPRQRLQYMTLRPLPPTPSLPLPTPFPLLVSLTWNGKPISDSTSSSLSGFTSFSRAAAALHHRRNPLLQSLCPVWHVRPVFSQPSVTQ